MTKTTTTTTTTSPMRRALAAAIRANVPVILWGGSGVGKTATTVADAREWGFHVETIVGSIREPVDFLGLPIEVDGRVSYSTLGWAEHLNAAERGLLFLDELTTSAPTTMKAMLRVLQERVVGEYPLGDHVSIVAAANPPDLAVDGWDLPAPVANRLCHLDWAFDAEGWLTGVVTDFADYSPLPLDRLTATADNARVAAARGAVTGFLHSRPDLLAPECPSDPTEAGRGWPSPRSWTNAMSIMAWLIDGDDDARLAVLIGCVGEGAAREYLAWEAISDLANPRAVLDDPDIVKWSAERPDRLFGLLLAVEALVRLDLADGNKKSWAAGMAVLSACAAAGRPDAAVPSVRRLVALAPEGAKITPGMRTHFLGLLEKMGRTVQLRPERQDGNTAA